MMYCLSNFSYVASGLLIDAFLGAARAAPAGLPGRSGTRALMRMCAVAAAAAAALAAAMLERPPAPHPRRHRRRRSSSSAATPHDALARSTAGENAAATEEEEDTDGNDSGSPQPLTRALLLASASDPCVRAALARATVGATCLRLTKTVWDGVALAFPKYAKRSTSCAAPFGSFEAINGAAVLFLVPLATAFLGHIPAASLVRLGTPGFAASPLLLALPTAPSFASFFILSSCFEAVWSPQADSWVLSLMPPGREGLATGLSQLPSALIGLAAGTLSGELLASFCPAGAGENCSVPPRGGTTQNSGGGGGGGGARPRCRGAPLWGCVAAVAALGPATLWVLKGWLVPLRQQGGVGGGAPAAAREEAAGLLAAAGGADAAADPG